MVRFGVVLPLEASGAEAVTEVIAPNDPIFSHANVPGVADCAST